MGEKTQKDLSVAFAGEAQAFQKYMAFAEAADKEGYPQVAQLFRATAHAEMIHARNHFRNMGGIKTTAENLQAAIDGETYEFSDMYPPFIEDAKAEGEKAAERGFHMANEAEKVHAVVYKEALDNLEAKKDVVYYLCPICGHISAGVPEKCPICGAKGSAYVLIK